MVHFQHIIAASNANQTNEYSNLIWKLTLPWDIVVPRNGFRGIIEIKKYTSRMKEWELTGSAVKEWRFSETKREK